MSRVFRLLALLLVMATPAVAQVSGPSFVFVAGTIINPDEVNSNFADVYDAALNRFGGTLEGHLLWSPDGTFDIGASGTSRPRDLFLQRDATIGGGVTATALASTGNTTIGGTLGVTGASTLAALSATTGSFSSTLAVTGAATLTSTLAVNSTAATAIDVAGGITAGSGNVAIIGTDGRIPSISSTTFASLSGANLTGILEAAITDGTLLARVAGNESITGQWGFTTPIRGADGSSSAPTFSFTSDTNTGIYLAGPNLLTIVTDGVTHAGWIENGNLRHNRALEFAGAATGATLAASGCGGTPTSNYNPTSLATSFMIPVAANASDSCLGGLVAQPAGNLRVLCNTPSTGGNLTLGPENGNSTAANRFLNTAVLAPDECAWVWYSTSISRWHVIATM